MSLSRRFALTYRSCLGELTYADLSMNEMFFKGLETYLAVAQSSKLQKLNLKLRNQVQPAQRESSGSYRQQDLN